MPSAFSAWKKTVESAQTAVSFDERFKNKTRDGVPVRPVYCEENCSSPASLSVSLSALEALQAPFAELRANLKARFEGEPQSEGGWSRACCIPIPISNAKLANEILLQNLSYGIDTADLLVPESIFTKEEISASLQGVHLEMAKIRLCAAGSEHAQKLLAIVAELGLQHRVPVYFENDAHHCRVLGSGFQMASSLGLRRLGATPVQELVHLLSSVVGLLRENLQVSEIEIRTSVGSSFFQEACKLRALRKLVQRVLQVFELPIPVVLHAVTEVSSYTVLESSNNLIRAGSEALSAALGGADRITILPFDVHEEPTLMGHRMACHMHTLLEEESHIGFVLDPMGGSWYFESLTENLAQEAWSQFQHWEAHGGAAESADFLKEVSASGTLLEKSLRQRKTPILGVSVFPAEGDANSLAPKVSKDSLDQGYVKLLHKLRTLFPQPPKVLVVSLGNPREISARFSWSKELLKILQWKIEEHSFLELDELASFVGQQLGFSDKSGSLGADPAQVSKSLNKQVRILFVASNEGYVSLGSRLSQAPKPPSQNWACAVNPKALASLLDSVGSPLGSLGSLDSVGSPLSSLSSLSSLGSFVFQGADVVDFFESWIGVPAQ